MSKLLVSELNIYPVKSMRQVPLTRSRIEAFGLQHDRRWMVVDEQGNMITQRQQARLCLIQPSLIENGIHLSADGYPAIDVMIPLETQTTQATVWDDTCRARDAGDEAAAWISAFLEVNCRLVYFPDDEFRQVDLDYAEQGDRTAFSDGFPLLLISQASLDDLNTRLATPLSMARFRPNLVVEGCAPYAEDNWKKIRIGETTFRVVKPCSRCVIPNIDIDTAQVGKEPASTLASYRRRDNKIYFGQNVIAENPPRSIELQPELTLGMPVEIIE